MTGSPASSPPEAATAPGAPAGRHERGAVATSALATGALAIGVAVVYLVAGDTDRALPGALALAVVGGLAIAAARSGARAYAIAGVIVAAGAVILVGIELAWRPPLVIAVLSLEFGAQSLKIAIPLAFAALGGAITERAGVIDLALEAKLLFGAFTAAAVGHATDSVYAGAIAGIAAGTAVAAVQMLFALRLYADQVIVGIALNILALAGTRFLLQVLFHEGSSSPACPTFSSALAGNPLFWLCVVATIAVPLAVRHTVWGVRLRAAGDRPDALVAVGASPARARLAAGLVGGALAGAGGAALAIAVGSFVADMSTGRGYMAIAMVILVGWRPALAALACLGIAAMYALDIRLQVVRSAFPRELAPILPYILTMVVLAVVGGRPPPGSLGKLE